MKRGKYAAEKRAGMAASFACLAVERTRPSGRIGLILPTTAAAAPTWRKTRAYLEEKLEEILVVAAQPRPRRKGAADPALSADTSMEEIMVIGTVRTRPRQEAEIIACATLLEAPQEAGEGPEVGKAILKAMGKQGSARPIRLGAVDIGVLMECRTKSGEPWGAVGVDDPLLACSMARLEGEGVLYCPDTGYESQLPIGMTSMEEALHVGPTHDLIGHPERGDGRGAYRMSLTAGARSGEQALWSAIAEEQDTLIVKATHNGTQTGDAKAVKRVEKGKGRLFYARGMRWTSQRLLAATTKAKAHGGSSWTSLQGKTEEIEKAYALWFNSTLGMGVHWWRGSRQHAGRSRTQIGADRAMRVPRLQDLHAGSIHRAAAAFDGLTGRQMIEACNASRDSTRQAIDEAVADMLNFGAPERKAVEAIRDLWCTESSVRAARDADSTPERYGSAPEKVQRSRQQHSLWLTK